MGGPVNQQIAHEPRWLYRNCMRPLGIAPPGFGGLMGQPRGH